MNHIQMSKEINILNMTRVLLISILLSLIVFSCKPEFEDQSFYDENYVSIAEFIERNKESYSTFYRIVVAGELYSSLSAYNPFGSGFTLFLPTDEAFERYIQNNPKYSSLEEMFLDTDFIRTLGRYHLVNTELKTNEFPYGSLPDTTATGDLLTIGFSSNLDSTIYKVNNIAPVILPNLEMINGYVHIVSEVLNPVNFTGFQWLSENSGYSILASALEITGLKDTLGFYRTNFSGQLVKNKYTILAEHDSIFNKFGINTIDDLVGEYATNDVAFTNPNNGLYQFVAYHILEGEYFLSDFDETRNYNSYAFAPVNIASDLEVRINPGTDTIRLEISSQGDTTAIKFVSLYYQESNVITKNGAIHFISEILNFKIPSNSSRSFQFYEEPEIDKVRNVAGTYYFLEEDQDELEVISWKGADQIKYFKSSSSSEKASNSDYLEIDGNFIVNYTIPKILPGRYNFFIRANSYNNNNEHATILIYIDGKRLKGNYNMNLGGTSSDPYTINKNWNGHEIGVVEFSIYQEHTITIESFIPGKFIWDRVAFNLPD